MPKFTVEIVQRPAIHVAGFRVRTAMSDVGVTCAKLWDEKFMPVMSNLPFDPAQEAGTYGVSVGVDHNTIDYYAAFPLKKGTPVPAGMEEVDLAAGTYCVCRVKTMPEIGEAFMYIYSEWPKTQDKYDLDFRLPCYEFYAKDFPQTGVTTIYCPVKAK